MGGKLKQTKHALVMASKCMACCLIFGFTFACVFPFPYDALASIKYSQSILDKENNILRVFLGQNDEWLFPVNLSDINPIFIIATLSIEDNRFNAHYGLDLFAIARAVKLNVQNKRVISGASTISMQVIRMVENRKRNIGSKIIEAVHALWLERVYSKDEILKFYFELAPYGGNIRGVKAAAFKYFKKAPKDLTLSEGALLAGLPQAPSNLRPDRYPKRATKRRNQVLKSMLKNGYISTSQYKLAKQDVVTANNYPFPFAAPHFVEWVHNRDPHTPELQTSLDPTTQNFAKNTLGDALTKLKAEGIDNGAIIIIENQTGKIRAMVSGDFFAKENLGQINGATHKRCPGSTLKPFTYALGFEEGLYTPKMMLLDVPVQYSGYSPINFDKLFRGPVSVRSALSNSLNIPAVEVLYKIGVSKLYAFMQDAGITSLIKMPEHYGLALTLGSAEVNLLELTNAYAVIARQGIYKPYSFFENNVSTTKAKRLLSKEATFLVSDILSETRRLESLGIYRDNKLHTSFAWKTGTSYGHKDAWTIGYNQQYTVGVWFGNFSARPARALVGVTVAAPLVIKMFDWLPLQETKPWYSVPANIGERNVCAISGEPVSATCKHYVKDFYIKHRSTTNTCNLHSTAANKKDFDRNKPKIVSPIHGCEYFTAHNKDDKAELTLSATGSFDSKQLYWFVDGKLYNHVATGHKLYWPMQQGRHKIACVDSIGRSSSITIVVR